MKFDSIKNRLRNLFGGHRDDKVGVNYLVATIAVTYRCQLRCPHCGSGKYAKDKRSELSTEEIIQTMRDLKELGAGSVSFFGGEPLLREDLCALIAAAREIGLGTSLDTNAVAMTPQWAGDLEAAGLNMIHVSLDSARPEVHDQNRNRPGLFEKAIEAIKYCKKTRMIVRIGTYVDREKLDNGDFREMLDLGKELGVEVRTLATVLSGRMLNDDGQKLRPEEIKKFKSMLVPGRSFWEQECCAGVDDPFVCSARTRENIYITASGDVTPCVYVPLSFGNIRKEPLKKIVGKMWKHKMFDCRAGLDCLMNDRKFRDEYFSGDIDLDAWPRRME